jgi:hypothetical protein
MKTSFVYILLFSLLILSFSSCQEDAPSLVKIYIRNAAGNIMSEVDVRLIADQVNSPAFSDEALTNQSGYALFNLDTYFAANFEKREAKAADFIVYVMTDNGLQLVGDLRARGNQTTEETFNLD